MAEPKIIQLTINIHIDSDGNVALSNTTTAQSIAMQTSPRRVFCPECGQDLKYADSPAQAKRKIAAHKRSCPGDPQLLAIRDHANNLFKK